MAELVNRQKNYKMTQYMCAQKLVFVENDVFEFVTSPENYI